MNQAVKAEREKKKSMGEILAMAIPGMTLVLLVTVVLLFMGEALAPINETAGLAAGVSEDLRAASVILASACTGQAIPVALNNPIPNNSSGAVV